MGVLQEQALFAALLLKAALELQKSPETNTSSEGPRLLLVFMLMLMLFFFVLWTQNIYIKRFPNLYPDGSKMVSK